MFARVTICVSDRSESERFYDTTLATLGIGRTSSGAASTDWRDFSIVAAGDRAAVTRGVHVGFGAPDHDLVRAFWKAGIDAGFRDDGAPGPRPEYGDDYFGGFLLDPDGNSAEGVFHDSVRQGVDHVWVRVRDVAASKAFYEGVAALAGFRLTADTPERAQFSGGEGSFSVVAGEPTRNLRMAFPGTPARTLTDPDGNSVEIVSR